MIRVGVIGCGYWGPNLVRVFNEIEGAEVVSVSDLRVGRREFIKKRFPLVDTTASFEEVINDSSIEAVVIATPPETHYSIAQEALRAGKHILVEKPLALTSVDAERIVETATRLGKSVAVGHLFLYAPPIIAIRTLLQQGELGEIYYVSSTRSNLGPPNTRTDVLWDLAPHDISIVLDLMGEPPEALEAQGGWFTNRDLAEAVFLTMHFSGGRLAHVHVSWLTPNKTRLFQLVCSRRVVVYDDMQPIQKVQVFDSGMDNRVGCGDGDSKHLSYGAGSIFIPALPNDEPLRFECEDFLRSIRDGIPAYSSGERGLEVVRVLEMASDVLRERTRSY
jgi:predicted dehydrogenase